MTDLIDKLKNANINIDSKTAEIIADQYITYKYIQLFLDYSVGIFFTCAMFYVLYKVITFIGKDE